MEPAELSCVVTQGGRCGNGDCAQGEEIEHERRDKKVKRDAIAQADTGTEPWAVVIKVRHAAIACLAMLGSERLGRATRIAVLVGSGMLRKGLGRGESAIGLLLSGERRLLRDRHRRRRRMEAPLRRGVPG